VGSAETLIGDCAGVALAMGEGGVAAVSAGVAVDFTSGGGGGKSGPVCAGLSATVGELGRPLSVAGDIYNHAPTPPAARNATPSPIQSGFREGRARRTMSELTDSTRGRIAGAGGPTGAARRGMIRVAARASREAGDADDSTGTYGATTMAAAGCATTGAGAGAGGAFEGPGGACDGAGAPYDGAGGACDGAGAGYDGPGAACDGAGAVYDAIAAGEAGGAATAGSATTIDSTGSIVPTTRDGGNEPPAIFAVVRTSTCVPPPWSACISAGERLPAPVNGASSSSHEGRKAVASRSRSSGVGGVFSNPGGPFETGSP